MYITLLAALAAKGKGDPRRSKLKSPSFRSSLSAYTSGISLQTKDDFLGSLGSTYPFGKKRKKEISHCKDYTMNKHTNNTRKTEEGIQTSNAPYTNQTYGNASLALRNKRIDGIEQDFKERSEASTAAITYHRKAYPFVPPSRLRTTPFFHKRFSCVRGYLYFRCNLIIRCVPPLPPSVILCIMAL